MARTYGYSIDGDSLSVGGKVIATKDENGRWAFDNPEKAAGALSWLQDQGQWSEEDFFTIGGTPHLSQGGRIGKINTNSPEWRAMQTYGAEDGGGYLGESAMNKLLERHAGYESRGMSDLTSRGLTGTTIRPTVQQGYQRRKEEDILALQESLRNQNRPNPNEAYQMGARGGFGGPVSGGRNYQGGMGGFFGVIPKRRGPAPAPAAGPMGGAAGMGNPYGPPNPQPHGQNPYGTPYTDAMDNYRGYWDF